MKMDIFFFSINISTLSTFLHYIFYHKFLLKSLKMIAIVNSVYSFTHPLKVCPNLLIFHLHLLLLGETVEENANLVVRLLIRRPECLGPALRGEGGGLLKAMKDGIRMSEQIAAARDSHSSSFLTAMNDGDDSGGNYLINKYIKV